MDRNNILNFVVILTLLYLVYYTYQKNTDIRTLISNDNIEIEMRQREEELNDRIYDAKRLESIRRDNELRIMMSLNEESKIKAKKLEIDRRKRYYLMLDDLHKRKKYATNLKLTRLRNQRKKQNEKKNEELRKKESDLKKIIDEEIKNEKDIEATKREEQRLNKIRNEIKERRRKQEQRGKLQKELQKEEQIENQIINRMIFEETDQNGRKETEYVQKEKSYNLSSVIKKEEVIKPNVIKERRTIVLDDELDMLTKNKKY
jgi:hypothetical protein